VSLLYEVVLLENWHFLKKNLVIVLDFLSWLTLAYARTSFQVYILLVSSINEHWKSTWPGKRSFGVRVFQKRSGKRSIIYQMETAQR
jgi:hypothetical protein